MKTNFSAPVAPEYLKALKSHAESLGINADSMLLQKPSFKESMAAHTHAHDFDAPYIPFEIVDAASDDSYQVIVRDERQPLDQGGNAHGPQDAFDLFPILGPLKVAATGLMDAGLSDVTPGNDAHNAAGQRSGLRNLAIGATFTLGDIVALAAGGPVGLLSFWAGRAVFQIYGFTKDASDLAAQIARHAGDESVRTGAEAITVENVSATE